MQNLSRQNTPASVPDSGAKPFVHAISTDDVPSADDMSMKNVFIIFALVIVVGVASGFAGSYIKGVSSSTTGKKNDAGATTMSGNKDVVDSAGIADKKAFSDSAEGKLQEKTKEDFLEEGSFKLVRPGGDSQTVHLTSSTIDMSKFVNKKVRVYGETFASEKVGWLMDVGFIEVIK